jgi:acyl carrier protein phosphodiesterase
MSSSKRLDVEYLVAIDTHVHIDAHDDGHEANEAARKYFASQIQQVGPAAAFRRRL